MITILAIVAVTALVVCFWHFILDFLNGPVRDLLERIFGAGQCTWYVNFLTWADGKMTAAHRVIKMYWKNFQETILKVNSKYEKNDDGTYTKTSESIVRSSPTSGRRIVTEEIVGWEYLPDSVRAEMVRQRKKEAVLDDKAVIEEKIRQRAVEDGIELAV
jgi:hypothetical protein